MTIYSQHANRGKIQILATYAGESGITSSTVTSVDDADAAGPIVDALNRISAYATVPVSVHDTRHDGIGYYPREHLVALANRDRRGDLLTGAHSLWYEYVKAMLHRALTDLDAVLEAVAPPVRTAVEAELAVEARDLLAGLHEFTTGSWPDGAEPERGWDFNDPFVLFNGGVGGLGSDTRESLDEVEEDFTPEEVGEAAADLRTLYEASLVPAEGFTVLDESVLILSHEPGHDLYYLDVAPPIPGDPHRADWEVSISQWDLDLSDPENEDKTATGESVLDCALPARPAPADLISLLKRSGAHPDQLATWAKTPVGELLDGTPFTVTKRYDN